MLHVLKQICIQTYSYSLTRASFQIGTRIVCNIRAGDGMEVHTRASHGELQYLMRVLGLDAAVRSDTFFDFLLACSLEQKGPNPQQTYSANMSGLL